MIGYYYDFLLSLPLVVSTGLFLLGWYSGSVYRPALTGSWVAAGIVLQLAAPRFSFVWLAGMLISVSVAIFLSVRMNVR